MSRDQHVYSLLDRNANALRDLVVEKKAICFDLNVLFSKCKYPLNIKQSTYSINHISVAQAAFTGLFSDISW